jgi:hypothetical protein
MKMSKEEAFELFWEHYHDKTGNPKFNKIQAKTRWMRLSMDEMREAYSMVQPYVRFMRKVYGNRTTFHKARTYLAERIYNEPEVLKMKQRISFRK